MEMMQSLQEWTPREFSKIILNTAREISTVRTFIKETNGLVDEDRLYETVIDSITYEGNSLYELSYAIYNDYGYINKHEKFMECVEDLGCSIHEQLKELGLYHNGVVNYRFGYLAGLDLVLYSHEYYVNHVAIPNIMENA